jgi:hypothetical protein
MTRHQLHRVARVARVAEGGDHRTLLHVYPSPAHIFVPSILPYRTAVSLAFCKNPICFNAFFPEAAFLLCSLGGGGDCFEDLSGQGIRLTGSEKGQSPCRS